MENKETAAENVIRWIMLEVEEMIGEGRDCRECDDEKKKLRQRDCREYGEGVNEEENQYALV